MANERGLTLRRTDRGSYGSTAATGGGPSEGSYCRRAKPVLFALVVIAGAAGLTNTSPAAADVVSCTPDSGYDTCVAYTHSGGDQSFTVPDGVTSIKVKAWGAGAGGSTLGQDIGAPGGSGGYVEGVLSVTPGGGYVVMIGGGGGADGTPGGSPLCDAVYGFGGACAPPRTGVHLDGGGGGGLSGLFTGSGAIGAGDQDRAVFVAGGGGAGEGTNQCGNTSAAGGAGGNAFAGTASTMQGVHGAFDPGIGGSNPTGGGGGYFGGEGTNRLSNGPCAFSANGGSNFITGTDVTDAVDLPGNEAPSVPHLSANDPPNTGEPQYIAGVGVGQLTLAEPGGDGLVALQWQEPPPPMPGISIDKTGSGPDPLTVGATVDYTFVVTNTGNVELTNVTVTDPLDGMSPIDCPNDTLAPAAEMTCTSTYTVTQEDVDTGFIENTATVTGDPPDGPSVNDEDFAVVPPSQKPGISVEKSGSGPDPLEVGATIDYTFLVTNTGNVTLNDVTITDPLPGLSPISCPDTTLASGQEMTCTATYTVTQDDVDAGVVENTATVTGQPPGGLPPPTDESTTTVPPTQTSGISIEKSGSGPDPLVVGATIDYTFVVTNTGNVTLTNVVVTDPLPGLSPINCPGTTLAPGAEMTCTATYEVTQADVDAGVVENTATVTGETPTGGPPPTDTSTTTVPPAGPVPALPPLALVLLLALLAMATLWTLRRARV